MGLWLVHMEGFDQITVLCPLARHLPLKVPLTTGAQMGTGKFNAWDTY